MSMNEPTSTGRKPLCTDAWAIPPSPIMLKHGNDYYTCSKCGEPCDVIDLKESMPSTGTDVELREQLGKIQDKWAEHTHPCTHELDEIMQAVTNRDKQLIKQLEGLKEHGPATTSFAKNEAIDTAIALIKQERTDVHK